MRKSCRGCLLLLTLTLWSLNLAAFKETSTGAPKGDKVFGGAASVLGSATNPNTNFTVKLNQKESSNNSHDDELTSSSLHHVQFHFSVPGWSAADGAIFISRMYTESYLDFRPLPKLSDMYHDDFYEPEEEESFLSDDLDEEHLSAGMRIVQQMLRSDVAENEENNTSVNRTFAAHEPEVAANDTKPTALAIKRASGDPMDESKIRERRKVHTYRQSPRQRRLVRTGIRYKRHHNADDHHDDHEHHHIHKAPNNHPHEFQHDHIELLPTPAGDAHVDVVEHWDARVHSKDSHGPKPHKPHKHLHGEPHVTLLDNDRVEDQSKKKHTDHVGPVLLVDPHHKHIDVPPTFKRRKRRKAPSIGFSNQRRGAPSLGLSSPWVH